MLKVQEGQESRNERHGPSFELHCNTGHPASRETREQLPVHYRVIGNGAGELDSHWLARSLIGSEGTLCWQEYVMQMQVTAHLYLGKLHGTPNFQSTLLGSQLCVECQRTLLAAKVSNSSIFLIREGPPVTALYRREGMHDARSKGLEKY